MKIFTLILVFCLNYVRTRESLDYLNLMNLPRHVHLSFGENPRDIVVSWSTVKPSIPMVYYDYYTSETLQNEEFGCIQRFIDGGPKKSTQYIYKVTLRNLRSRTHYAYKVSNLNTTFDFWTLPEPGDGPITFGVYGDFGLYNSQSLNRLIGEVDQNNFDFILHVGDFAYNMDDENGERGDKFLQMIQPITSRLPYMTTPGNHENSYNFSNYKNRFNMPSQNGDGENMYYSYNIGPVHFVSICTEFYFYVHYGLDQIARQYKWLLNDLEEANKPENRRKHPWIILLGHRPIYCSNYGYDCTTGAEWLRNGIPGYGYYSLEEPLKKYNVNVALWAHEHSYERMLPVYQSKVCKNNNADPYTNPTCPVHFVTGSAGCQEHHDFFRFNPAYSVVQSDDYGYSKVTINNGTYFYLEQISDDKNGTIVDNVTVRIPAIEGEN